MNFAECSGAEFTLNLISLPRFYPLAFFLLFLFPERYFYIQDVCGRFLKISPFNLNSRLALAEAGFSYFAKGPAVVLEIVEEGPPSPPSRICQHNTHLHEQMIEWGYCIDTSPLLNPTLNLRNATGNIQYQSLGYDKQRRTLTILHSKGIMSFCQKKKKNYHLRCRNINNYWMNSE